MKSYEIMKRKKIQGDKGKNKEVKIITIEI